MSQTLAIGIDLGTTNSCVAVCRNKLSEVIFNNFGKNITSSYVSFTDTDIIVGKVAKNQRAINLDNTVYDIKRLIGRRYDDKYVLSDMKQWPFKVIEEDSKIKIRVKHKKIDKTFTPEELSAMVLIYLKRVAEDYLGVSVKNAVITVPAYFNNSQREATKLAGQIAGLNVLRILSEPTAAALAYGHKFSNKASHKVLVYDFGGGTFDVSILYVTGTNAKVLAVRGNTHLGGNDINENMAQHFIGIIKDKHGIDLSNDRHGFARLIHQCENVKMTLSAIKSYELILEQIVSHVIRINERITRETFENLNKNLFQSTLDIVDECLRDAKLDKAEIDEIILVGGSTRIPKIKEMIRSHFNNKQLCKSIHPDEAVAIGAAILADALQSKLPIVSLQDVIPRSLGINIKNFSSTDNFSDLLSIVIDKNTTIPVKKTRGYQTVKDNQTSIHIGVYEGEERLAKDNYLLGEFNLEGLTRAPKGETKLDVTFNIDHNGIINVHSKERNKDNSNEITIVRNDAWSDEEIKRMIATARDYVIN